MTLEKALEGLKSLYEDIDKEDFIFFGTLNPDMFKIAIDAIDYQIKKEEIKELIKELEALRINIDARPNEMLDDCISIVKKFFDKRN